jgi:hypothetical protein
VSRYTKLRISRSCEAGIRYEGTQQVNYHEQCSGMEDRRVGRNFRCQCACHRKAPGSRTPAPTWAGNPGVE